MKTQGWISVSAGSEHSCAISNWGKAYCWGLGDNGQLGIGANPGDDFPLAVDISTISGKISWMQISSGMEHSCGVTSDNSAYCWGQQQYGKLGNDLAAIEDIESPVLVLGSKAFTKVVAGYSSTCGLTTVGKIWCWGNDAKGQLGNDNSDSSDKKSPVAIDLQKTFVGVFAGGSTESYCALASDGNSFCWGSDNFGQVGNGNGAESGNIHSPAAIAMTYVDGQKLFSVVRPQDSTCAIEKLTGAPYCWGSANPVLGNPSITGGNQDRPRPVDISSLASADNRFVDIDTSSNAFACGMTDNNKVFCWGNSNTQGFQGTGSTSNNPTPVEIDWTNVSGEKKASNLSVGDEHSCLITTEGDMYCWGDNTNGQIGDDNQPTDALSPVPVVTPW